MSSSKHSAGKSTRSAKSSHRHTTGPIRRAVESLESRRLLDGSGLLAQYYNTTDLTGTPVTRMDANVNFNWTNGAPENALNPDNYTARWTGQVQPTYSQTYTFSVNVTGGTRLWVNGTQLINQWAATGTNTFTGTIALTAGTKYSIQLEYAEKTGNAAVSLSWSSASQASQVIPQSALYGWSEADIGSPGAAGSSTFNSGTGTYTLTGAGNYWLEGSDSGHTVYQQITGDAQITMRIANVSSTSMLTGLFVRNSMNANSAGGVLEYWNSSVWSVARLADGQKVDGGVANGMTAAGLWLKLVRVGNTVTGYTSPDGQRWEAQWGRNVSLNQTIYIGMLASSNSGTVATATVDNVSVRSYDSNFQTSWIGNSGNGAGQWVQNDFKGVYVDPATGELFINSPYDEGGHEAARYLNGVNTGGLTDLHGWARSGGWGITADANYVYLTMSQGNPGWSDPGYPPSGSGWNCIRRYDRATLKPAGWTGGGGYDSSMLIVNTNGRQLTGMVMIGNNLYVSDPTNNQVKIYNKTTMTSVGAFTVARPGHMAVDGSNNIWIVSYSDASNAAKILKYDSSGNKLTPEITGIVSPLGIAYNPATGQLLVTEDGPRQQILKYSNLTNAAPTLAGTLGDNGGIASGTPGAVTPTKFDNPSTVAADAAGNIYVGFNGLKGDYTNGSIIGIGAVMRSFNSAGSLNWEMRGLEFVDSAAIDPATDGLVAYTKDERFTINYANTGTEFGTWVGRTVDETTNAGDPRLTGDGTSVWIKVLGGQTFMVTTGQGGGSVRFYKKVAGTEMWKLCGDIQELAYNGIPSTTIWRDTNNDGIKQSSEVVNSNVANKDDGFGFDIDSQGNVWSAGYYSAIRKYVFTGLDGNGAPIFSTSVQQQAQSTIFNRIGRVAYEAATDTMFISGWTAANPFGSGDWGMAGSVIARYNNWSTSASLAWSTVMPYNPTLYDNSKAISLAGNRLFVGFVSTGSVRAYDTATGALVQDMARGPEIGGYGGWLDTSQPMNAFRRSNGMYVISVEDDLLGKVYFFTAGGITPTGLTATAASGSQINLSWSDNNNKESGFVVQRSTDGTNFSDIATLPANMTSYSATGLSAGTTYYFRVRANNSFDNSPWSTVANATTSSSVPAAPSNLTATAASSSQINLAWTDNSTNETGFSIDRATNSGFTTGLVTTSVGANVTSSNITGLSASTTYYFRVRATGSSGNSAYTATANATTQAAIPAAPSALTATPASSSQINLAWADNSSNETGFSIDRATNSGFTTGLVTTSVGANVTTSNITGLTASTTYYFRVRATGSSGNSAYTSTASATTQAAAIPAAPSALSATAVSNSQINLAWTDNASNETGFEIDRATNSGFTTGLVTTSVGANVTTSNITGLTASTTYYFRVRATGSSGNSAYTSTASATTQATSLGVFSAQSDIGSPLVAGSGNYSGGVYTLTGAGDDIWGNTDQFRYVYQSVTGDAELIAKVNSLGATDQWAKAGVMVRETLTGGSAHAIMALTPSNGAAMQYRTTTGGTSGSVAGAAVAAPYWVRITRVGNVLTGYTSSDGTSWTQVSQQTISMASSVYFGLAVTSHVANTATTAVFQNVSLNTLPAAPSGLTATAASSSQINLAWTDNSSNETGFAIDRATNSTFTTGLVTTTVGAGVTSSNITGLTASTTYYFRVRATNTVGASANTSTASATTQSGSVPNAPSGLAAAASSSTQIHLTWYDNSSDETGFQIDVATVSDFSTVIGTIPLGSNTNNNTISFLTPNTTYYFRIRATGANGNSAYSNTASATTLSDAPTAPSGLAATVVSSSQLNLSWTDNSSNETGFSIDRATDSGFTANLVTNSVAANTTTYNATGLSANTTYYFRVRATGSSGNSAYTSTVSATTLNSYGLFSTAQDVGSPGATGSTSYNSGTSTYTIQGAGADMWEATDAFHMVSSTVTADATITARVDSFTGTSEAWAKAGVILRESTASNSIFAAAYVRPDGTVTLQWRATTGGLAQEQTTSATYGPTGFPKYVRLARVGNVFTGYYSTNGTTWTQIGTASATISMASTASAGLFVCSHTAGTLATATFTNVSLLD